MLDMSWLLKSLFMVIVCKLHWLELLVNFIFFPDFFVLTHSYSHANYICVLQ